MTTEKIPYAERMKNWIIEQHSDCANFKRAKEWAQANGYELHKDISYNGFIELRKEICTSNDPHDGNELEIQVWANDYVGEKYHSLHQSDMEIDFENDSISKPMKYRYKAAHGRDKNTASQNLEEVFTFAEKREVILKAEFAEFLRTHPTTEWKCTDPDNFQYMRLNRGTPEFREFKRDECPELFETMKKAPQHKVDNFIKEQFEELEKENHYNFLWYQSKITLSMYKENYINEVASTYYKDLNDLKKIYGKDWEIILAECIFEQETGLY